MPSAADSLALELVVPDRVRTGDPVPIELRVQNRGQRPLDLYLRGRTATFDVVITGPGSEIAWQRLAGEIIPAIVHLRTLAPAERLALEALWNRSAPPGDYVARGLLLVEGAPLETPPVPFRIIAR